MSSLSIANSILDINFKLYLFIKEMNSTNGLTNKEQSDYQAVIARYRSGDNFPIIVDILRIRIDNIKKQEKKENMLGLLNAIESELDLTTFYFAIKLLIIKDLLLALAKIINLEERIKLSDKHPLSLAVDTIEKSKPYYIRVHGALISLVFFKYLEENTPVFLSECGEQFMLEMRQDYAVLKAEGVEPNQIFMLMFTESVNQ